MLLYFKRLIFNYSDIFHLTLSQILTFTTVCTHINKDRMLNFFLSLYICNFILLLSFNFLSSYNLGLLMDLYKLQNYLIFISINLIRII